MSDEQYRAERRRGEQQGLYEATAVKALRAGDVDGLRELLLEKLPLQLVKDIISTHPSLSYRAIEWEENPRGIRTSPYGQAAFIQISTAHIPPAHRRPTLNETLSLIDARSRNDLLPNERTALNYIATEGTALAHAIQNEGMSDTTHIYTHPQLTMRTEEEQIEDYLHETGIPPCTLTAYDTKHTYSSDRQSYFIWEFIRQHPNLASIFFLPQTNPLPPIIVSHPNDSTLGPLGIRVTEQTIDGNNVYRIGYTSNLEGIAVRER